MPINTRVRDQLRFSSVQVRLHEEFSDGEVTHAATVAKASLRLVKLLDPFAVKQFQGKPRVVADLQLDVDRNGSQLEAFCAADIEADANALPASGGVPRSEKCRICLRVQLNPDQEASEPDEHLATTQS